MYFIISLVLAKTLKRSLYSNYIELDFDIWLEIFSLIHIDNHRCQERKWIMSDVLITEFQKIQKQETNKQLSKTAWHFFCWSASKGENTFLLVDFYGFKDHVFKPTRRQLARKKTGSNKTLNWRKREGLPTARNLTEAVNNTQTRRDYSIFL